MSTQIFALTRIAAKTWGCSLVQAREVYTEAIRAAVAYGASAYHTPTEPLGEPRGLRKALETTQTNCLKVVSGAYKAASTFSVETETFCPPLDLYLNKRVRAFEERLARLPAAAFVKGTPAWVAADLRGRRGGRQLQLPPVSGRAKAEWADRWAPRQDIPIPQGEVRKPTSGEKKR